CVGINREQSNNLK
ncbi:unnamed protein product, partial [Rotaria magnacalcarata]